MKATQGLSPNQASASAGAPLTPNGPISFEVLSRSKRLDDTASPIISLGENWREIRALDGEINFEVTHVGTIPQCRVCRGAC